MKNFFKEFLSKVFIFSFRNFPVKFNLFLAKIFKKIYDLLLLSNYTKDRYVNLNIENNKFKLFIMKNDLQAQTTYLPLHNLNKTYETVLVKILLNLLKNMKNPVFMDIGSHMGYYANLTTKFLDDKFKVYAIESNPNYCKYIETSKIKNKFNNLEIINETLSDKSENFFIKNETALNKSLGNDKDSIKIQSDTLDNILHKKNISPNILKIDVHGVEGKVLLGSKNILEKSVKYILLELHSNEYISKYSDNMNRRDIILLLIDSYFDCYLISSHRDFENSDYIKKKYDDNLKFEKIKITKDNFELIFFNRENNAKSDELIFCCKKNDNLANLEIF